MKKYKTRNDVPEKYKWDLNIYFKNDQELIDAFNKSDELINKLSTYKGCTKSVKSLKEFIELDIKCSSIVESIYVYSFLSDDVELGKDSNIVLRNKSYNQINKYEIAVSFFVPELLKLKKEEFNSLINSKELSEYKIYLESSCNYLIIFCSIKINYY